MTIIKLYILPVLLALVVSISGLVLSTQPVHASSQVLFGGFLDPLNSANATEYNNVSGGCAWNSIILVGQNSVSSAGKIKRLYVELDAAAGAGADDTYTFTLMYDGAATALTCAIVQGATSGSDTAHEIDVVAGKKISIRCVSSGSPSNTPNAQWSMIFSGTTAKESLITSMVQTAPGATTYYFGVQSAGILSRFATELYTYQIIPTNGKIKNLYVLAHASPGAAPDSMDITLRLGNAANSYVPANTALTVNLTAANYSAGVSDTVHEITVAAGDIVDMVYVPNDSPTGNPVLYYCMTFVADTDGESVLLGGVGTTTNTANTAYINLVPKDLFQNYSTTETTMQQLGQICVLKNLYVRLRVAPNTGAGTQSYTYTVESDTATATAITTTISEAATTGNDTVNTATLAAGNNVCLKCVPSASAPAASFGSYWGLVSYIAPPATGRSFGIIIGKR